MSTAVMSQDSDLARIVRASFAPAESQPPIEAERAVLGAILLRADRALPLARPVLESVADPFAIGAHAEVWRAICELADAGKPVDPATVTEYLRAHWGPLAPNAEQVSALTDSAPTSCHAPAYARDVAAAARSRDAERTAALLAACLRNGDNADAARLIGRLAELTAPEVDKRLAPSAILSAGPVPEPLFTFGPAPGKFGLVLGDSSVGKTFFLLSMAVSLSTGYTLFPAFKPAQKIKVCLFASEDSAEVLRARLEAIARVHHLPDAVISEAFDSGRLQIFADDTLPGPLFTADPETGLPTTSETFLAVRDHLMRERPALALLDPLLSLSDLLEDNQCFNFVAQTLKRLSGDTGAALLLSHHTSKHAARAGELSQHSARGGAALEGAARWVSILGYEAKQLCCMVCKNSYGGRTRADFDRVADGVLVQVDPRRRMEQTARDIAGLLRARPGMKLTRRMVEKNEGDGRTLRDVFDLPKIEALEAVDRALELGLIRISAVKRPGGGVPTEYLVAVPADPENAGEGGADNECPF